MRYVVIPGNDWMAERLVDALRHHAGDQVLRADARAAGELQSVVEFRPDAMVVRMTPGGPSQLVRSFLDLAAFGRRPVIALAADDELHEAEPAWAQAVCFAPYTPERLRRVVSHLLPPMKRWEGAPLVLRCGAVELREDARVVLVDGERADLTYAEFEVLDALMRRPGIPVTRSELRLPQRGGGEQSRAVDVYVRRLRVKLAHAAGFSIETVPGVGYRCATHEAERRHAGERVNGGSRSLSIPV